MNNTNTLSLSGPPPWRMPSFGAMGNVLGTKKDAFVFTSSVRNQTLN